MPLRLPSLLPLLDIILKAASIHIIHDRMDGDAILWCACKGWSKIYNLLILYNYENKMVSFSTSQSCDDFPFLLYKLFAFSSDRTFVISVFGLHCPPTTYIDCYSSLSLSLPYLRALETTPPHTFPDFPSFVHHIICVIFSIIIWQSFIPCYKTSWILDVNYAHVVWYDKMRWSGVVCWGVGICS